MADRGFPDERRTLLVEAYGPQPVQVTYATAGGPEDRPYVVLRSPGTLVYCLDAEAVTAATFAWLVARARATRALPAQVSAPTAPRGARVIGSVTFRGPQRFPDAHMYPRDESPDGRPHMLVRLDGLTVRAYDRASLAAHARGWVEALDAAGHAFERPPRHTAASLLERAHEHVRGPYGVVLERGTQRSPANQTWLASRSSEPRSLT